MTLDVELNEVADGQIKVVLIRLDEFEMIYKVSRSRRLDVSSTDGIGA